MKNYYPYNVTLNPYVIGLKPGFNKHGNVKLGSLMWSFSTLAGNTEIETDYGSMCGTCGGHACGCWNVENGVYNTPCYVGKSYRYPSVRKGHARNTIAARLDIVTLTSILLSQLRNARKKPDIVRLNQSGELENDNYLYMFMALANFNPGIKFYIYTKAYEIIERHITEIPKNLIINISVWHENGIEEYKRLHAMRPDIIKAFVYDDGYEYTAAGLDIETYCTAYDQNGKLNHAVTCEKCRKCIDRKCCVIGCYDH